MPAPADRGVIHRRRAVALVSIVAVAAAIGWALTSALRSNDPTPSASGTRETTTRAEAKKPPAANPQRITPLVPGTAHVVTESTSPKRNVALTFDDGFCPKCVARIVDVLQKTGAHASFFPNGRYAESWDPQAERIKQMVSSGQLTLGNHTFSHNASTTIGAAAFGQDLQRNEDWIEKTFGVTGRPWFRPPYGDYDSGTVAEAGQRGYTKVVMWSGTVADSSLRSQAYILNAIKHWARPGRIILMHGNYPPTADALPRILNLLDRMDLHPVTMAELAATGTRSNSPSTGY